MHSTVIYKYFQGFSLLAQISYHENMIKRTFLLMFLHFKNVGNSTVHLPYQCTNDTTSIVGFEET